MKPTPTYKGVAINSQYFLRIVQKHDAWNDIRGKQVEIPVTIMQGDSNHAHFNQVHDQPVGVDLYQPHQLMPQRQNQ
jgi:hypothetical protein